ncbi:TPA: DUF4435 domain-containing protein [Escherichia coli]|uniref:DUF4435 domain-containing protein n=2 Tax=Escherichia coli TaxID=562 RepID=UPI000BE34C7D|nr:DUF4435 domain-containing protein [Escherichia coli]EFN8414970.1 DUF4435 domain-containing protein [Escherichia coli O150]EIY2081432.1 DUF4435 domain-containing protein [Escherichia coli]STM54527.1 Uncharacterised protein [Escherichia coli]HAH8771988.1 DUF4435 domain-containing protein [Escherichia coli]
MPSNAVNIDSLNWSDEAENVISMFYGADIMVYVEGGDDIGFWEIVFSKNGQLNVEVQDVGGCEILMSYVEKITSGKINAIVARDADLNHFSSNIIEHPNVIYTRGYSIENSILNERVISRVIKNMGKYSAKEIQNINKNLASWLNELYSNMENLIYLDIYNHISMKGLSVVGDSCERFMKSKSSCSTCLDKINSYIQSFPDDFKEKGIAIKENLTYPNNTTISNWLRGHFLFSATLRFITNYLAKDERKAAISKDSFYSNILTAFELYFTEEHADYEYYNQKISLIA